MSNDEEAREKSKEIEKKHKLERESRQKRKKHHEKVMKKKKKKEKMRVHILKASLWLLSLIPIIMNGNILTRKRILNDQKMIKNLNLNNIYLKKVKKMEPEIKDDINLGRTVNPFTST